MSVTLDHESLRRLARLCVVVVLLCVLLLPLLTVARASSCAEYGLTGQTPWTIYGNNMPGIVANQEVINPVASRNGLRGETSLPYVVPVGRVLFLESVFVEAL